MQYEALEQMWEKWPVQARFPVRDAVAGDEPLETVAPTTPLASAAAMFGREVDLLVVCAEQGRLEGVVTKTDLVGHLARQGGTDVDVGTVMSRDVVTGRMDEEVHELWRRMVERGVRSVPVVAETGVPVAVLTRRHVSDLLVAALENEDAMLKDYVMGVGYR
jgi:CBS domain-containing protein